MRFDGGGSQVGEKIGVGGVEEVRFDVGVFD